MEDFDADLLKECTALAKNRVKLEYGMLAHPMHARMGEAYHNANVSDRPEPASATVNKQGSYDKGDQQQFKSLLIQAYSPLEGAPDSALWWKISMRAAHIVPMGLER